MCQSKSPVLPASPHQIRRYTPTNMNRASFLAGLLALLYFKAFHAKITRPVDEPWPMNEGLLSSKQKFKPSSRSGFGSSSGGLWAKSTNKIKFRVNRIYEKSNAQVLPNKLAPPTTAWKYDTKSLQELVGLFDAHPSTDQPDAELSRKIGQVLGELISIEPVKISRNNDILPNSISEYGQALCYISGTGKPPKQLSVLQMAIREILVQRLSLFPLSELGNMQDQGVLLNLLSPWITH
ncbi:hypothetical protein PGT21_030429 [Puccinia graminis f. sp. tritici]|uniref:Uncharacterized protein n=1 Tax=Puccinia graminis f. sp. tritici TaxID=56615 RepID=A0A5B0PD52_PUCGR|nr:hypothetical protein PGT21_030429 [Puccinia graminis f. sp. tritici]KAA1099231.1 hypothetical protein PGTUg99_023624 [Puccinia graminis f. sp. tritici]